MPPINNDQRSSWQQGCREEEAHPADGTLSMGSVCWKDIGNNKLQPGRTSNGMETLREAPNVPMWGAGCKQSNQGIRESLRSREIKELRNLMSMWEELERFHAEIASLAQRYHRGSEMWQIGFSKKGTTVALSPYLRLWWDFAIFLSEGGNPVLCSLGLPIVLAN